MKLDGRLSLEPELACPVPKGLPRPASPELPPEAFFLLLLDSRTAGHLAAWMCVWRPGVGRTKGAGERGERRETQKDVDKETHLTGRQSEQN